jgi:hypothetical protein
LQSTTKFLVFGEFNLTKANAATLFYHVSDNLVGKLTSEFAPSNVKGLADLAPIGTDLDNDEPLVHGQKVDKVLWASYWVDFKGAWTSSGVLADRSVSSADSRGFDSIVRVAKSSRDLLMGLDDGSCGFQSKGRSGS